MKELTGGQWQQKIPLNGSQKEIEALWDELIAERAAAKKARMHEKRTEKAPAAMDEAAPKEVLKNGKRRIQDFTIIDKAAAKKIRAADLAPANADKKLWAALFTSAHGPQAKETYSCRSTSARGWM